MQAFACIIYILLFLGTMFGIVFMALREIKKYYKNR